MTAFQAFRRGWLSALRSKVALLLMWFSYALVALIVAAPAAVLVLDSLAHSRMATKLLPHFDVGWLGDLVDIANPAAGALSASAALAGVLTWLLAVLFAGGVLTMLDEHWERFSFTLFCSGAGEHFWRILRLSLLGIPCFAMAWGLGRIPSLLAKKIYGQGMEGWPLGVAEMVGSVLTLLLLGWVAAVLDYAKVRLVSGRKQGAFKALLYAFLFVFRRFTLVMGVWFMNAILFALLGVVYLKLSSGIQASTTWTILLLVVVQQVFIFFRTAMRVAAWGSALNIYRMRASPNPPIIAPELVASLAGSPPRESKTEEAAALEPPEWEGYGI